MVLNKRIEDEVYFAWRKAQVKAMETERLGIIHVSDLIKPCMRYVAYSKITPHEYRSMSTEDLKSLYFGQILHNNSQLAENPNYHEMFVGWNYIKDVPISYEDAKQIKQDDPIQLDIIYGKMDDVLNIDGEWVIVDKKTTGSMEYFKKYNKPSESHVAQLNCYRVLLNKCYNIDAKKGCNLYIDNCISKETRDEPKPIVYALGDPVKTEAIMKEKASQIKEIFLNHILPERTRNFMCDGLCPFATKCFTDERKTW